MTLLLLLLLVVEAAHACALFTTHILEAHGTGSCIG
jgi:hypothetical protein